MFRGNFLSLANSSNDLVKPERQFHIVYVSTAEKIFQTAQTLPEPAQNALLQLTEMLASKTLAPGTKGKPRFGSAKGLVKVGPEFDDPLDDFKPYTE